MIFAAPFAATMDISGLAGVEQQIKDVLDTRKLTEDLTVEVVAGGSRGSVKNALIAHAQANERRNPFYLHAQAQEAIRFVAGGLTSAVESVRRIAAEQIGELMLDSIRENVGRQMNRDNSRFKALTPGYAKRKQRAVGFVLPILKATGDLLGGLRTRIRRGRSGV